MEYISTEESVIQVNGNHSVVSNYPICSVLTNNVCGFTGVATTTGSQRFTKGNVDGIQIYPEHTFYTVPPELRDVMQTTVIASQDCLVFIKHSAKHNIRLAYLHFIQTAGFETFFGFFPGYSVEQLNQSACTSKNVVTRLTLRQQGLHSQGIIGLGIIELNKAALCTEDTGEYEKWLKIVTQGSSQISLMMRNVTLTMMTEVEKSTTQCLTSTMKNG